MGPHGSKIVKTVLLKIAPKMFKHLLKMYLSCPQKSILLEYKAKQNKNKIKKQKNKNKIK